jgi:hypothetical protein
MFHPERDLKAVILDLLKEDGKSISAISRDLKGKGFDLHRLILTGYLRAMTDLNVLREREVPPSKIYVPVKGRERDIYEMIGSKAREMFGEDEHSDAVILFTLNRLFKRPIFFDELIKAGAKTPAGREATKEERQEAKLALTKSGYRIPDSSKAYLVEDETLEREYLDLLTRILIESFDAGVLVKETKQTRLSF